MALPNSRIDREQQLNEQFYKEGIISLNQYWSRKWLQTSSNTGPFLAKLTAILSPITSLLSTSGEVANNSPNSVSRVNSR